MQIISRKALVEASATYPDIRTPLDDWYRVAKSEKWQHLEEVRKTYPKAEAVGNFTVFNIKGNRYRLIVGINYSLQKIYIKYVLTHADYDKGDWKNDPYY